MLLFVASSLLDSAYALDLDIRSNKSSRLDFSLNIDRDTLDLEADGRNHELDLTRIGIVSIEVPPGGLQFGLLLGYAYADFANNSNFETLAMDGYYIGISARAYLLEQQNFALSLYGHYLYQSIDGTDEQAKASLAWDELRTNVTVTYKIPATGILYGGVSAGLFDARYKYDGVTDSRIEFENEDRSGVFIGFGYEVNRFEEVAVKLERGMINGISLRFRKLF